MFDKTIIIDGKDHLLGRLASIVAKQLLLGQRVVVVRTDKICISGSIFRNVYRLRGFMGKTRSANPRRGHIHYHNPARIFWRTIRGMTPHKTARGAAALGRLKTFEGVPAPYDQKKRLVVPDALKAIRIKNFRKTTVLGDLAEKFGWTKKDLVNQLEDKRKARSTTHYKKSVKSAENTKKRAEGNNEVKKINEELAKYGF